MNKALPIGHIIAGSLTDGLMMRINGNAHLEGLKTGKFVSIYGDQSRFFSLITDLKLEVSHPDILLFPPTLQEPLLKQALATKDIYATATLRPMLMLTAHNIPAPVKTIPSHFSAVFEATAQEIALIFGDEKDPSKKYFTIGCPLDMEAPVCLNLEKLTERSNGIFGKTGTGKTFLTRLVLAGLIHNDKAVNLIFDMHSEYGLQARKEGNQESFVKGLKTLFPDKVVIFSLDPASTRRRGGNPDVELTIPYSALAVEDIISLDTELNLNPTAYEAAYLIAAKYKKNWLETFLSQGDRLKEFAQEVGAHPESIAALYRKLKTIERFPFIQSTLEHERHNDVIDRMIEYIDKGISIIIEFGNFTSTFCYLLIANIITRRIHTLYMRKTEQFLGSHKKADEPKKLMITIEEAHKFLNPQAARQTIFGTIAREMRKYYVSLLVVDQRPSGIDPEVLSQIGTKIIAQLNDEKDIQAVLNGVSNASQLRSVLATLETKKQAVIVGHAIAMPVVIQTREYDEKFYKAMMQEVHVKPLHELIHELF
ncbi:DUF87 domain-containing protein [Candidatus Dependentiae bacterium]|nr:DUF87 domain-containing protein [Candidatus Dependentiae bacterium]